MAVYLSQGRSPWVLIGIGSRAEAYWKAIIGGRGFDKLVETCARGIGSCKSMPVSIVACWPFRLVSD